MNSELIELKKLVHRFAQKEMAPLIQADEKTETFRPELIQKAGQLGLCGIPQPERFGGAGLGALANAIALEEIAKVSTSYAISIAVSNLPQTILSEFGSEEQKQKYIPGLAQGQAIGAFSLSEAGSGSDARAMKTTAKRQKDFYIIRGTKLWTTQGDSADVIALMAKTENDQVSTFIVEKGMPGFKLGKREKKMGCHISHTMELIFEDLKLPLTSRVGEEGNGFKIAKVTLDSGRINIGACAVGVAQAALEVATQHAQTREQFGKPIGEFQGVGFMLADMATQIEASRLLVHQAANLKDQGQTFTQAAAMAKLFATDTAMKVTTDAVQILGGSGYTQDFPVERYMREAKVLQIVEGTNQIQRLLIARSLLNP